MIARLTERDGLLPFSASAVATLIEHGARVYAQAIRLTSRFGRIAGIAREAAFIAKQAAKDRVDFDDIIAGVKRSRGRAENPVIRFRRMTARGALKIQIIGPEVGQINGLPINQNLAMTGAVDQKGNILAIGGAAEKI